MKLVVGLGNVGREYDNTRHNVGFMFLDGIIDEFKLNKRFNALECEKTINNERVIFIKPLSFMNLSGEVVVKYVNYYKINISDILVIQDDLDMDLGKYKLMYNHGDGGHNGIKNIILNLGSREFLRLKIGISNRKDIDTRDYVLGKFNPMELKTVNYVFNLLNDLIIDYICLDREILIGKYNSKIQEG